MKWSLLLVVLWAFQERFLFKPKPDGVEPIQEPIAYGLRDTEVHKLATKAGTVTLWHRARANQELPTFIVFHGNTGHFGDVGPPTSRDKLPYNRRYRIVTLKAIADSGAGFVAVSLPGYGASTGKPSEKNFHKAIRHMVPYLQETLGLSLDELAYYGESLGAVVALHAAAIQTQEFDVPPALVGMVAAFESMAQRAQDDYPEYGLHTINRVLRHRFETRWAVHALQRETKLYIAHPKEDGTTKPYHSSLIADYAKEQSLDVVHEVVPGGHITWDASLVFEALLKRLMTSEG